MREKIIQTVKQTSLSITQNEIQAVRRKNIKKTGCRVLKNQKIGVAGALGEVDDAELFARAEKLLSYAVDYPVQPTVDLNHSTRLDHFRISDSELSEKVAHILRECRKAHPDFAISNKVNVSTLSLSLENEKNLSLQHYDSYLNISFILKSAQSTGIMDTFFGLLDRRLEVERIISAVNEVVSAYKNLLPMPGESLPIVIHPDTLTRLFQRDLNGKLVGNKASLFQQQLGTKVFSEQFSLKIATNPEESFSPVFDMEGTITEKDSAWLVKNGEIVRPYTDKKTAARFGFVNTGCADGAYDSVPSLGGCNLEVCHSEKSLKQLLNGQSGILIQIASGGDFTPDGQFASPVQVAYLTDGEKLLGRLPEFSIKGSVFDFFGDNFIGVSSDKFYACGNDRLAVVRMTVNGL
jgi:PmbA protein